MRAGLGEFLSEFSIVRHQEKTFACIIETPNGVQALLAVGNKFHHRRTALWIGDRSHVTFRLVQHEIQERLGAFQRLAIHRNLIHVRIGFRALLRDDFSIQGHPAGGDNFFRLAPRGNSRCRHYFLQTFRSHEKKTPGRVTEQINEPSVALVFFAGLQLALQKIRLFV